MNDVIIRGLILILKSALFHCCVKVKIILNSKLQQLLQGIYDNYDCTQVIRIIFDFLPWDEDDFTHTLLS